MDYRDLPEVNALLNGASTVLLICGFIAIKRGRVNVHRRLMVGAVATSSLFLVCYLTYHALMRKHTGQGHTSFVNPPWFRPIYLTILYTHLVAAISIVPLVILTVRRALLQQFDRHKALARWTWPLWMYVSVTGVVIYFLLYQIYPQRPATLPASSPLDTEDWREFRGVNGQGISDATDVPLVWSEKQNIKWKTALPGKGASSPVVISNQIWVTTATENERSLRAICLARDSGKIVYDVELFRLVSPEPLNRPLAGHASPTAVAEPGRIYFSFGAYGCAAVADTGRVIWRKTPFLFSHDNCGPGSSPILYGRLIVIAFDGVGLRCVAALDKQTGNITWQTERPNPVPGPFASKSFSTPVVAKVNGRDQILSLGPMRLGAYDPAQGKELWACDLPGWSIVARPVLGSNVVYVSSGGDVPELWAIRLDGASNETRVAWRYKRQIPMVSSPLLVGEQLYFSSDSGMVTCLEARTGEPIWSERLNRPHYASPLLAQGRIYWFGEDGTTTVIKPDVKLEVLAENKLDSGCLATPAIAGRAIFLRTKTHLYRIEE